ncbi:hypothetical protein GCM10009730_33900 [Streptomyces albidochromogenes]|uniref:hypothetical protein n=1 Tax=Streptomyces albidochromogenes TaxID=329524 RepID=UPI001AC003B4|nr:hypothetical protein [Streptomyces albidochromogenes]
MPRILPNAYTVGRNMTKAKRADMPVQRLISSRSDVGAPAVRMGEWVFTPPVRLRFAQEANATLHDNDRCIDLRYSSPLLEHLLAELGRIEADFVTLSSAAEAPGGHRGQPGGQRHA